MAMHSLEKLGHNLPASGLVAASQAAVGFGAGLLVSQFLSRSVRDKLAITLLATGTAILVPVIAGVVARVSNRPESTRRQRRQLEGIREHNFDLDSEDTELV